MVFNLFIKILFIFFCSGLFSILFAYSSSQKYSSLLNWIQSALITISSIVLISFILLIANVFSIVSLTLSVSILCISIFLFWKYKKQTDDWSTNIFKLVRSSIVPFLVLVGFLVVSLPKISEWSVSSGMDAGNYVNIASRFTNTGKFFDTFEYDQQEFNCLSGYYCSDGLLKPAYLHVYPILLSIGELLDKDFGMAIMQISFASLSLLSFYSLIRNVFKNKYIAGISSIIFLLNPLQILYSKEFMSEILSQFFLFAGLNLLYLGYVKSEKKHLSWAGISLALMLLTKFDSLLIVVPLCLIGGFLYLNGDNKYKLLRHTFVPFFFVSLYYLIFAGTYTLKSLFGDFDFPDSAIYISFVPILYFISSYVLIIPKFRKLVYDFVHKYTGELLIVLVIILELSIFLRMISLIVDPLSFVKLPYDNINFLRLSFFTTLPILIVSFLGLIAISVSKSFKYDKLILLPFVILLGINLYRSMHSAPLYWWGRRYLLFALPLVAVSAGFLIYYLFLISKGRLLITKIGLLAILAILLIKNVRPAFEYKQNSGIDAQVLAFANAIPDESLIIGRKIWQIDLVGSSVASIYDKNIVLYKVFPSGDFLSDKLAIGETIYWISPTEKELVQLIDLGLMVGDCMSSGFDYTYFYSLGNMCDGNPYCLWHEDLTIFRNKFALDLCEVVKL